MNRNINMLIGKSEEADKIAVLVGKIIAELIENMENGHFIRCSKLWGKIQILYPSFRYLMDAGTAQEISIDNTSVFIFLTFLDGDTDSDPFIVGCNGFSVGDKQFERKLCISEFKSERTIIPAAFLL